MRSHTFALILTYLFGIGSTVAMILLKRSSSQTFALSTGWLILGFGISLLGYLLLDWRLLPDERKLKPVRNAYGWMWIFIGGTLVSFIVHDRMREISLIGFLPIASCLISMLFALQWRSIMADALKKQVETE